MKFLKFKEILRKIKIDVPDSLPSGQWENWEEEQKKNKPIAYFFQLVFPRKIENLFLDITNTLWHNPRYAIKYRTTHRYHVLYTGLEPRYYDLDTRIIHGIFNELVNFVECEKAWLNARFGNKKYKRGLFERFRSAELGVDYLQWEISLEDDINQGQSESAKEVLELYKWWKEIYLNRKDPYEESGLDEYYEKNPNSMNFSKTANDEEISLIEKTRQIENDRELEDTEMLIRLIKIRKYLWT